MDNLANYFANQYIIEFARNILHTNICTSFCWCKTLNSFPRFQKICKILNQPLNHILRYFDFAPPVTQNQVFQQLISFIASEQNYYLAFANSNFSDEQYNQTWIWTWIDVTHFACLILSHMCIYFKLNKKISLWLMIDSLNKDCTYKNLHWKYW